MSILSRHEIKRRLSLHIGHKESVVVTPLLREDDAFSLDSVDLRLGSHFLFPQLPPVPFSTLNATRRTHANVHVPFGKYVVVPAHQTVLGMTLEFIKLPYDISGQILTKSSIARTFMVIETAPWIHPLYRGCLTLEIANVSNTPLLLHPGTPIGQLILLNIIHPEPPEKMAGNYIGPTYPEAPAFRDLKADLEMIGVPTDDIEIPSL